MVGESSEISFDMDNIEVLQGLSYEGMWFQRPGGREDWVGSPGGADLGDHWISGRVFLNRSG